ncbi:MAG: galactonate dehydratase, partial [Paraglaciecola psychrophila]
MKIRDFKTFVVGNPPPQFGGRYWIFIKLVTDCGIVGYGEVYNATFGPHTTAAMIEDVCERHVVGHDPFKSENLFRKVYASGFNLRPDVSLMGVLSGIEMACWDIVGKALDQPVYNLLGGQVNEKLRSYTYIYPQPDDTSDVYRDPDLAASHAAELVEQGFTAVKFDPAGRYSAFDPRQPSLEAIERSVQFCKKIREAVGTKADLLFGTHGQFSPAGAIRLAKQLEPYDPLWFEEPCPPDNAKAMAQVSEHTSIPVATGERLTTKYEFLTVLENRSASILQMALGRVGGILEGKKIAAMAEAFHTQIAPHLY